MAETTNLSLHKPAGSDTYDRVADLNDQWDILDDLWTSVAAGNSAVGDAASASTGGSLRVSRVDHRHGRESFGSPVAIGTANADGAATTVARSNHVHLGGANADGTVGAPGIYFGSDTDNGLYRIGANNVGVSIAGAKEIDISATVVAFSHAVTVVESVTAADLVATDDVTVGDDLVVTGLATVGETLAVTGITTATGGLRIPVSGGTVRLSGFLFSSSTWDPATLIPGDSEEMDVTVTGVADGDFCLVTLSSIPAASGGVHSKVCLTAEGTAADTVTVVLHSGETNDNISIGSGTLRILVIKAAAS